MKTKVLLIFLLTSLIGAGCLQPDPGGVNQEDVYAEEAEQSTSAGAAAIKIEELKAAPASIEAGQSVKISWKVSGADKAHLYIGPRQEPSNKILLRSLQGSMMTRIYRNTDIVIAASNDKEIQEKQITVTVKEEEAEEEDDNALSISLTASQECVIAGEELELHWEVSNADRIDSIPNFVGSATASGSVLVRPEFTTEYKITGIQYGVGTASESVTVQVIGRAYELAFETLASEAINGAAFVSGADRFYLATDGDILEYREGALAALGARGGEINFTAVAVDPTNPENVLAAKKGVVYLSEDGGESWPGANIIPVYNGSAGEEIHSVAAQGGNIVIGTPRGIHHVPLDGGDLVLRFPQTGITRIDATADGFFAFKGNVLYYSRDGREWETKLISGVSPKYIFSMNDVTYAATSGKLYRWNSAAWTVLSKPEGNPSTLYDSGDLGLVSLISGQAYLEGEGSWDEIAVSGEIPSAFKGTGIAADGVFLWDNNTVAKGVLKEVEGACD